MPANLPPDFHKAEEEFRAARTAEEKIAALEQMLRVMPKHKGTDHLQADIRSRIAKLRRQPAKKGSRSTFSHTIPREGAGQIALVGPPNTGKSSLVAALTHATPEVADYPFTTREATPGMMPFEDIAFQLLDLPPLSRERVESWVFDLIRHADLLWIGMDALDPRPTDTVSRPKEMMGVTAPPTVTVSGFDVIAPLVAVMSVGQFATPVTTPLVAPTTPQAGVADVKLNEPPAM